MATGDPRNHEPGLRVRPTELPPTADVPLWTVIRNGTDAISFQRYERAVDDLVGASGQGLRGATERFLEGGDATAAGAAHLSANERPAGPHLVELIWSFWLEEGRLTET